MEINSILENLCLNLCTEIIGIFITVFIIDRLIKSREAQRWKQAKATMYANILNSISDTIRQLPNEFLQAEKPMVYYYGNSTAIIKAGIREQSLKEILPILEKEIRKHGDFDVNIFFAAKQRIGEVINSSAFLLEPTLTELLLTFDQQVSILKESNLDSTTTANKQEAIARVLPLIFRSITSINSWLVKQSDKSISFDEHLKSIMK
jgi:hypothetical protein